MNTKEFKLELNKIAITQGHDLGNWQKIALDFFEDKIQQTHCKKCGSYAGFDLTEPEGSQLFGPVFSDKCDQRLIRRLHSTQ